jgi:predicted ArsR family transcriptional regulator
VKASVILRFALLSRSVADLSDAKRRIIERLKRVDSATAPELAAEFDTTDTAIRQHLDVLAEAGLVERAPAAPSGRGRPPVHWRLTQLSTDLFPDRHAELSVELLAAIREALGDDGIDKVIAARTHHQEQAYRRALPDPAAASVKVRVRRLAELRTAEGYMAEAVADGSDTFLVEHHCPICDAAAACQGFCRYEQELFQTVLGDDVEIERVQHLLSGDARCAYRVTAR